MTVLAKSNFCFKIGRMDQNLIEFILFDCEMIRIWIM